MATAYRLQKIKHNSTTLSGAGSADLGGRWNNIGTSLIYASSTSSLAVLEKAVHLIDKMIPNMNFAILEIPDECIRTFTISDLPTDWDAKPALACSWQFLAFWFEKGNTLACSIPSAINPNENNLLINPNHPDINRVRILDFIPYTLDCRLIATAFSLTTLSGGLAA
ncbi:RES family NAD+ phosphorylase [Fibrella forsythiae]|uniref:RES domain-containing protein n=1 Tax=Fibrella forsythiae TaxID=2817061 RepID=A0ABS3JB93_9BACT|nr:RES domain-containing protein [Fibrella forsythiae]MBO0947261.1 RES domain-containing protein [Fibrella forsythiae]